MKNVLLLSNLREIRSSVKRFISLAFISLLGVGFFVGIKVSSVDMLTTLDNYFDEAELYDIKITAPLGFSAENLEAITALPEVQTAQKIYYRDEIAQLESGEKIIKLIEQNDDINRVVLIEGELPQAKNQIAVESNLLSENDLKIGDVITVDAATSGALDDTTTNNANEVTEYEITGVVESPLYLDGLRDTSLIGNGKVNYFAYAKQEAFTEKDAQNVYVLVNGAQNELTADEKYLDLINDAELAIEIVAESEVEQRLETLFGTSNAELVETYDWILTTRSDNTAYGDLMNSTDSIENIGNIFPLVFYVVAILVSLISMKRMVEDDRGEIGTLKSLGFNNWSIIRKYLRYAFLAVVIGSGVGVVIGSILLPKTIWSLYNNTYILPELEILFSGEYITIGVGVALVCIMLVTFGVAIRTLKEVPASLLRPKAPKNGRRVWLERVKLIWGRLNFSSKICVRNIFRYKSRVFAMIIGVMGSTALILTAFGLKDSLTDISSTQFGKIFNYDEIVAFTDADENQIRGVEDELEKSGNAVLAADLQTAEIVGEQKNYSASLVILDENTQQDLINFYNAEDEALNLPTEGVLITAKLAELLQVSQGEKIQLRIKQKDYDFTVEGITENYLNHYVYMSQSWYEGEVGTAQTNTIFVRLGQDRTAFDDYINALDVGTIVTSSTDVKQQIEDVILSLNSVIAILILSSSILAFVVMYNLSAINISERQREIATLKVLGFYNKEVDGYINRETNLLTILGTALGLLVGYYLCHYILVTCEIESLMFVRQIEWWSYLYTIAIVALFTIIVNWFTHWHLRKINMLESLKTVE